MKPQAFKLRGNTGNTGYGFEQVLDGANDHHLNQPNQKLVQDQNQYDQYQFAVPGNMGSLKNKPSGPIKYNLNGIFAQADLNKDGVIDEQELAIM